MMRARSASASRVGVLLLALTVGCHEPPARSAPATVDDDWSTTVWGRHYEVFAETEALVAGHTAISHPHVTVLADFAPLRTGSLALVLRAVDGHEHVFGADKPKREGIFAVAIQAPPAGTFELEFRVESAAGREVIPAGRVRVGTPDQPGGALAEAAQPPASSVAFLKEQQWRTPFATAWAVAGALRASVSGPARVRTASGGEALITAPADAHVAGRPWPHVGLEVAPGATLLRLIPRTGERGLPEIQADADALTAEVEVARRRVARLEELLALEATSAAEVERARATRTALEARLSAARQGLSAARTQDGDGQALTLTAPWTGRVAELFVSPGQTVAAGATLARVVRTRPVWLELALRPEDAARLSARRVTLHLRRPGDLEALALRAAPARLVARAPELDARSATLAVLLELDISADELPFGSVVEADLLLPNEHKGIVVPLSTIVQDAGTSVAYVQLGGEAFERRDVRVLARAGQSALVDGLNAGERVVTIGGAALRRSSLLSSGAPEGHVH